MAFREPEERRAAVPGSLKRYGRLWLHVTFGERNAMVRFPRAMKERTRCFYNDLPSDSMTNLQTFVDIFMLWCKHPRRHQGLYRIPWG